MNQRTFFVLALMLCSPISAFADCSSEQASIIYVNGVLTDAVDAQDDLFHLQDIFARTIGTVGLTFINAYNPSHLSGAGDWFKSIEQIYQGEGSYINDYDINQMLLQLYPELSTRHVLLVGHSQGTFYSNALFDYFSSHGISTTSMAVYNIATPAHFVAGGGRYLTSSTDKVIADVRELASAFDAPQPLPPNISIPLTQSEVLDPYGGHLLSVYTAGASYRIAHDMNDELQTLAPSNALLSAKHCFTPPPKPLGYVLEGGTFALADPTADALVDTASAFYSALASFVENTFVHVAALIDLINPLPPNTQPAALAASFTDPLLPPNFASHNTDASTISPIIVFALPTISSSLPAIAYIATTTLPAITTAQAAASTSPTIPRISNVPPLSFKPLYPGFGGGAPPLPPVAAQAPPAETQEEVPSIPALQLSILAPDDNALLATTSVVVLGTSTPGAHITADGALSESTTTADGSGNWSVSLVLAEGVNQLTISAVLGSFASVFQTRTITVDTTPPNAPNPTIEECVGMSLCQLPTGPVTVVWDEVPDAVLYQISLNYTVVLTTSAHAATVLVPPDATSTIEVAAIDLAGNTATSSALYVGIGTPYRPPGLIEI